MSAFATIEAEIKHYIHAALNKARSIGHHSTADLEQVAAKLKGDEAGLATEAHTDEMQLAQDAKPVVAEVKTDAEKLAGEAGADVKQATQPSQSEPPTAA